MVQEQALRIFPKEIIHFRGKKHVVLLHNQMLSPAPCLGPYYIPVTEYLYLLNPTDRQIAFKVKTTAPDRFHVRPVFGFVAPGGDKRITIQLQSLVTPDGTELGDGTSSPFDRARQKFMVESAFVPDEDDLSSRTTDALVSVGWA